MTVPVPDVRSPSAPPRVVIAPQPLDRRTSGRLTVVLDIAALVASVVVVVSIVGDRTGPLRAIGAVVVAVFVPGWTIARCCGWMFSAATLLTSIALSVSVMIVVGQIAVTRTELDLEVVAAGLITVCIGALALVRGLTSTRRRRG